MSDLLEEVDEMMRQERMVELWKEHGSTLLTAIAAIILATAAISGYRSWDANVRHDDTAQLVALLESPDFPANLETAELDMRPGLEGLALLNAAGQLMSEDKSEEAQKIFERAANDKSIPAQLRDVAVLSLVHLNPDNESAQSELKSVWSNSKSPWRHHARLDAAVLSAQAGDYATARRHLNAVLDTPALPETLYNKAQALEKIYALKQNEERGNNNAS
ncbi:MAG: hypothetical protein KDJ35_08185 [Alphaproteobacteria bacterium]|nr:hypothetical protein [Alphaproteobacteria bacterium]